MNIRQFYAEAQEIAPWIEETRHALHRIPETGFQEFKTQALICRKLDELGISYATERTWVVADIRSDLPGPTVGLRADIDALPVTEPEGCPFRSEHDGWMHACGHDAHAAILLGAAKLFVQHRDALRGNVRLFFQPAEETDGGAKPMVEAGAMKGVCAVYGLHMHPAANVGQICTRPGTLNAATNEVNLTVRGVSGHAARPNEAVDAIVCAAHLLTALQTAVSRSASPLKPAVLTFGKIEGGTARNVICDRVILRGTLRTVDPELRALMIRRIREISAGIAAAFGTSIDVEINDGYDALINDAGETRRILRLARELLGESNVTVLENPSMGGEDFSYFANEAPGAFFSLGCATRQPAPALHHQDFYVDERCLPIGAAMHCALVFDRLNETEEH